MGTFTCEDALEEIGLGRFQKIVIVVFGMVYFADGSEFMVISLLGSWIQCAFKVQEVRAALMNASVFIGLAIGGPVQGFLIDIFGRKRVLVLFMAMLAVLSTLFALSPTYRWVIFLRFVVGVFLGPKAITYAVEFFPTSSRRHVLFIKTFWSIGTFVIMGCAYVVMMYSTWRILMLIVAAVPLICACLLQFCVPESPRYLVVKGRLKEATDVLGRIAAENKSVLPAGRLVGENLLSTKPNTSVTTLFKPAYLKTTLLLFFLWTTTAFVYYGVSILSVTYMLAKGTFSDKTTSKIQCTACTPITNTYYILQMIFAVADLIGNLSIIFLVDRIKRKTTFIVMCIVTLLPTICLYFVNSGPIVSLTLFISKIGVAGQISALIQYTVEVFPTVIRGTGVSFVSSGYSVGAALTPFVAEVLVSISLPWALGVYSISLLLSALACWSLSTETTGIGLKDY